MHLRRHGGHFMQEYGLFQVVIVLIFNWFSPSRNSNLTVYVRARSQTPPPLRTSTSDRYHASGCGHTSTIAYPLLSAYFLTAYAYKRMRLITRVYCMTHEEC